MLSCMRSAAGDRVTFWEAARTDLQIAPLGSAADSLRIRILIPIDVTASGAIPIYCFLHRQAAQDHRIHLDWVAIEKTYNEELQEWWGVIANELSAQRPTGHA